MAKHLRIKPSDKMSDAINNNAQILMSMSRFGISLGFGEKCIKDVCDSQNVDCNTFLAVVNFIREKSSRLLHLSIINNFVKYILFLLLLQKRRC